VFQPRPSFSQPWLPLTQPTLDTPPDSRMTSQRREVSVRLLKAAIGLAFAAPRPASARFRMREASFPQSAPSRVRLRPTA